MTEAKDKPTPKADEKPDPTEGSETAKREESTWKAYLSACQSGGTAEERKWAFSQWLKALDKRTILRRALTVKKEEVPTDITTDA